MNTLRGKKIPFLAATVFFFALFHFWSALPAAAVTLFLSSPETQLVIGQTAEVTVRVDSEGENFNAAEATLKFPKDILEIKTLNFSSAASVFNFWLEEPTYSNQAGTAHFIGGATNGISGASISLLKLTFVARGSGRATIDITDAAVTASDGSGTNILSKVQPLHFSVGPTVLPAPPLTEATATLPITAPSSPTTTLISLGPPPPPVQIIRQPVAARSAPVKPVISVPVYPEENAWYNITTNFLVRWDLPSDIIQVATALNQNKNFTPPARSSEGLFESKIFPALSDGTWYVHIRFRNNVGWGPTTHYRIALDTTPPAPFTIESAEGLKTDIPQPTLSFATNDGLSGLKHYVVQIDAEEPTSQEGGTRTLPLQPPGTHVISVKAVDKAGNTTAQNVELEIIPIVSPIITAVRKDVFAGEGNLTLGGTALPQSSVLLTLRGATGAVAALSEALTDTKGNWQGTFDLPLKKGTYTIDAVARDGRGALSLPVTSEKISVREKPLLIIAGVEITWIWIYILSTLILIGLIGWGWWWIRRWQTKAQKRAVLAERDVENVFASAKADLDTLRSALSAKTVTASKIEEARFLAERLKRTLEKVEGYIIENIEDIPD